MAAEVEIVAVEGEQPPERRGDRLVLLADRRYRVLGPALMVRRVAEQVPGYADLVAPGVLLLTFGNAVGRIRLPFLGEVELVSGKWDEADFDRMLEELTEAAAALPFQATTGPGHAYDRGLDGERLLYHAFVYLRHVLGDRAREPLRPALDAVVRDPHRRFEPVGRTVPVERARSVGTAALVRMVERPDRLGRAGRGVGGPVAAMLGGQIPERVEEDHRRVTLDTAENRFVLAFLEQARDVVERVRRVVEARPLPSSFRSRLLRDCDAMAAALAPVRRHPLWRDVGRMHQLPAASTVLQRRRGYREVFRHYVRLRLATRLPLAEDPLHDLLELKDIATLYELWTFFAVERAVTAALGRPLRAALVDDASAPGFQLGLARGVTVEWPDGTQLAYNATWSKTGKRRSTSVVLRPDIALTVPSGAGRGLHLFDAKFRLRTLAAWSDEDDAPQATFQKTDLYKMHTYRDAIPEARSVWILYPGTESRFFPADQGTELRDGVGAVPLVPGEAEAIGEVVMRLLGPASRCA